MVDEVTAPVDLEQMTPAPSEGIPNHHASSGERGDKGEKRPGIFGGASTKPSRSPKARGNTKEVPPLDASAKDKLAEGYVMLGMGCMAFDPVLGGVIMEQAPVCANAVFEAAQTNESVRRVVIMLTTGGIWAGLLAAHLPILLTLAGRHAPNEGLKNVGVNGMRMLFQRDIAPEEEHDPSGVGNASTD